MMWNALKRADIHVYQKAIASEPLGLKLTVHVPSSVNFNVLARLKSLIDGVIAAFHVYNGSNLQEVSKRLMNVNSMSFDEIEPKITDSSEAVLGRGILFNPIDQELSGTRPMIG